MTSLQIEMVQASWKTVAAGSANSTGSLLYEQLLAIVPEIEGHLSSNENMQPSRKMLSAISYIIRKLHKTDVVVNKVEHISRRHIYYNVQDEQYILAGKSLLTILAAGLGEKWNRDMENAWINCYTTLAEIIMNASRIDEPELIFSC